MATIVEVNDEVHAHPHNGRFVVVSFRNSHSAVSRQPGSSKGKRRGFQISWIPETRGRAPRLTSGLIGLYLAALSRSRLQILPKYFLSATLTQSRGGSCEFSKLDYARFVHSVGHPIVR